MFSIIVRNLHGYFVSIDTGHFFLIIALYHSKFKPGWVCNDGHF